MEGKHQLRSKILTRIAIVFVVTNIIWLVTSMSSNLYSNENYARTTHFLMGLFISFLIILLLLFVCKKGNTSWSNIGFAKSLKVNFIAVTLGIAIWLIPALIGTLLLQTIGLVDIGLQSGWGEIIGNLLFLFLAVFLIEALPEELIFRGYIFSQLQKLFPDNVVILLQVMLFTLFAYLIGSIYSLEQLMFIPGFAFILGYFRAISKNIWVPIGFHLAIMTGTQLLGPLHNHFVISNFFTLQFAAFILFPSAIGAIVLNYQFDKRKSIALN
ncbi:hypothetical protein SAMN04487944_10637 [Gracilibacillus ureilyticus]|uniref:CAAX prenyl protease 2/Lysostaphin resistance protein A-like domain-containing protein n=1 Tax=Gracilibacillus ureilyticus TaxID=531814 RepID=A0A1H9Q5E8_9BACI|nr:CPBP family intramembrane glutamic endopeptidase [Gracilibacillus ureilyticus]SER55661.1 hypothetical protein SAMN04487944_10637 [Gracilibacillus ureilyticus]